MRRDPQAQTEAVYTARAGAARDALGTVPRVPLNLTKSCY